MYDLKYQLLKWRRAACRTRDRVWTRHYAHVFIIEVIEESWVKIQNEAFTTHVTCVSDWRHGHRPVRLVRPDTWAQMRRQLLRRYESMPCRLWQWRSRLSTRLWRGCAELCGTLPVSRGMPRRLWHVCRRWLLSVCTNWRTKPSERQLRGWSNRYLCRVSSHL